MCNTWFTLLGTFHMSTRAVLHQCVFNGSTERPRPQPSKLKPSNLSCLETTSQVQCCAPSQAVLRRQGGMVLHSRELEWRLVALTVQFAERVVKIILVFGFTDVFVSLSQDVKDPLPSIPAQQIFITEVRDGKFGISSQCSPQEHSVSLERDIRGAQPLFERATVVAPGLLWMVTVPLRKAGSCRSTSVVHHGRSAAILTTKTTLHRCDGQTRVTTDSNYWHSNDSIDHSHDFVGGRCEQSLTRTGARAKIVPELNVQPLSLLILFPPIPETIWHITLRTYFRVSGGEG